MSRAVPDTDPCRAHQSRIYSRNSVLSLQLTHSQHRQFPAPPKPTLATVVMIFKNPACLFASLTWDRCGISCVGHHTQLPSRYTSATF